MNNIMQDVIKRTNGELYIGIVGSVRCGKSTFIKKFMEQKVLPLINDEDTYKHILDELPLSGEGRNITTVEPKFVPSLPLNISISDEINFRTRLVDCVGYVIKSAKGYLNEDGTNRLVETPWFSEPIPFNEASTIGTKKVIENHANLGIVLTSDGSFGEFSKTEYEEVLDVIVGELQELKKPFVILVNTKNPNTEQTIKYVNSLSAKYNNIVIAKDVQNLNSDDVDELLKEVLNEYDINELHINVPSYIDELDDNVTFKKEFNELIAKVTVENRKLKSVFNVQNELKSSGMFENVIIDEVDSSTGNVIISIEFKESTFVDIVEQLTGMKLENKTDLIKVLKDYRKASDIYNSYGKSIKIKDERGYDLFVPDLSCMKLDEPTLIKQGNRYGIKIKATSPIVFMMNMNVESTFEPIIGNEAQANALVEHMKEKSKNDVNELWNSEIFGRKLCDVILDGIYAKTRGVTDETLIKFKDSLEKVVNYSSGGILAIML